MSKCWLTRCKRPAAAILLCNLFLALTVAFFSPVEVLIANAQEFYFPVGNVWWGQLLAALAAALVLTCLMLLLPVRAGQIAAGVSFALGLAAYAQILLLNGNMVVLTGEDMTVTEAGITWNLVIWGLIILAVLLAVILSGRKHRKGTNTALCAAAAALVLMQAAGLASSALTLDLSPTKQEHALTTENQFALGKDRNVVVFVFDTADGSYAREMVERWPELSEALSGWTYYPNTVSRYSRTYPSLPYMLTGVENTMDRPVTEVLDEAYTQSAFLKGLSAAGVDNRILTPDQILVSEKADPWVANSTGYQYSAFGNLNLPELEANLMKIALYKCAPYRFKECFSYELPEVNASSFRSGGEDYDFSYMNDDFQYDLEDAVTVTDRYGKAFRFFHLFGTHYGARWDENLEEMESDEEGADYPAVMRGCFRNVESMIEQMKALGIYDNATIIVTGDHGLSGHAEEGENLDLHAPAPVLMMVKLPGADLSQPMRTSEAPVSHDELFATIEQGLDVSVSGTGSGKAFADFAEGEARDRVYDHTMLRRSNNADIALREYLVQGDAEKLENWHDTGRWWDILYTTNPLSDEKYP